MCAVIYDADLSLHSGLYATCEWPPWVQSRLYTAEQFSACRRRVRGGGGRRGLHRGARWRAAWRCWAGGGHRDTCTRRASCAHSWLGTPRRQRQQSYRRCASRRAQSRAARGRNAPFVRAHVPAAAAAEGGCQAAGVRLRGQMARGRLRRGLAGSHATRAEVWPRSYARDFNRVAG